eukprot:CAMPEP_0180244652 /NCGR_PEP_ID=MMETSP0987-20121128/34545_1 /TAXON_ID=697907 /ORGANISM="non described non described, Strain CCMP2293" /LENGTH=44 /DNA_ID= /DNA_START= /DNA_END= /DNA_ORIENTATION=
MRDPCQCHGLVVLRASQAPGGLRSSWSMNFRPPFASARGGACMA